MIIWNEKMNVVDFEALATRCPMETHRLRLAEIDEVHSGLLTIREKN
jgi:hypothetical protein